jgi:hypothetical protein
MFRGVQDVGILGYQTTRHDDVWESGGIAALFFTSVLDIGEWSASRLARLTSGAHWIGGWVGPKAGLDALKKKNIICPCLESNHDSSVVQSLT